MYATYEIKIKKKMQGKLISYIVINYCPRMIFNIFLLLDIQIAVCTFIFLTKNVNE